MTKIHLPVDHAGRPLRLIANAGQTADITCANELVEYLLTAAVIAGKGYESVATMRATDANSAIPLCPSRIVKCRYSRVLYRIRNIVERFFNRVRYFSPCRYAVRQARGQMPYFSACLCIRDAVEFQQA